MFDASQLGFVEVVALTFVLATLAATQLRAKGLFGWLAILAIVAICVGAVVSLEGAKQAGGFFGALAGLAVGGKFSDWRALVRTKQAKAAERRERDARFK